MTRKNRGLVFSVLLAALAGPHAAQAQAGWHTQVVGKKAILTPPDLGAGESFQIVIYPRAPMGGALITDFLDKFADREAAALGKPSGKPSSAQASSHTFAATPRTFVTPQGAARTGVYSAICMDGENARIIGVLCPADGALFTRYQAQTQAVLKEMIRQESNAAVASGRGLMTESLPAAPGGMTPGGPVVPGVYVGSTVKTDTHEIVATMRLYLFAGGQYRLCNSRGEDVKFASGDDFYDPITGRLKIGDYIHMACFKNPADGYCLYGRGADGKPYLQAQENATYGRWTTVLRYAGPPDKPSMKQEEAAKAAAEAEARRYKYVTAPGKGVQPAQIAAVLWQPGLIWIGNMPPSNEEFLVLKDGTIHRGLEVAPDTLDMSLSRRKEPEKWGKWRKRGEDYYAAWPDKPGQYQNLNAGPVTPGRPGERLTGFYSKGVSGGDLFSGGYSMFWGVSFGPDGRFLKSRSSSESTGAIAMNNSGVVSSGGSNDGGSYTSVISPQVTAGSQTRRKGPARSGTYSFSGYTMILHYDDGHVEREPFFFIGDKRDFIYFEGGTMNLQEHK